MQNIQSKTFDQRFTSYQIVRDRDARTITLHQHDYISEVLEMAQMSTCAPISAPPTIFNHLSHNQAPQNESEATERKRIQSYSGSFDAYR